MKFLNFAVAGLLGALLVERSSAQSSLLELRQDNTRYNLGSTNGLPISTNRNLAIGSDGRAPTPSQQAAAGLTLDPATTNQFRTLVVFGGVVRPTPPASSLASVTA